MKTIETSQTIKTYAQWKRSKLPMTVGDDEGGRAAFLNPGDAVDARLVSYVTECATTNTEDVVQCGEPECDGPDGYYIFATFRRTEGIWRYTGHESREGGPLPGEPCMKDVVMLSCVPTTITCVDARGQVTKVIPFPGHNRAIH